MKFSVLVSFLAATFLLVQPVLAQQTTVRDSIVAVVNDDVITTTDLNYRVDLLLKQVPAEMQNSEGLRKQLEARAMTELMRESLYRDFAKQRSITITPQELDIAIATIERNNSLPAGSLKERTDGLGQSLKDKVTADILWQKVISQFVAPRIQISNAEVDQLIEGFSGNTQAAEYELEQIFISAEASNENAEATAQQVYNNLKEGANFKTQAIAFSEDSFAESGGYMGWFGAGELAPQLRTVLEGMDNGDISAPIRSGEGYHILRLLNTRTPKPVSTEPVTQNELVLLQRTIPQEDKAATRKAFEKELDGIDNLKEAQDFVAAQSDNAAYAGSVYLGYIGTEDIAAPIRKLAVETRNNRISDIAEIDGKWVAVYKGGSREVISDQLKTLRQRVRERLEQNRTEMATRQLLRNLRRQAFVDVRL